MTASPCYKCNKRTITCRKECADFKRWEQIHLEEKEKIIQAEKDAYYLGKHDFDMFEKLGRKQRWK